MDAGIAATAAELRQAGRRPYPVPRGGATPLGAFGYVRASLELAAQLAALGERPRALWTATGSCGTQAGLVARASLASASLASAALASAALAGASLASTALAGASHKVIGVTVSRPVPEAKNRVRDLAARAAELSGLTTPPAEPEVRGGWIGPGYGQPSAAGQAAAHLVARTEGVFLDPVFGAKAMAALIADCRSGRAEGTQVFLVSGGAPTLFAGSQP